MAGPLAVNQRPPMSNPRSPSMVNLQLPIPAEAYQLDATPEPQPHMVPVESASKPMLGPLGFIAIGAVVAVACFLVVHNLLK